MIWVFTENEIVINYGWELHGSEIRRLVWKVNLLQENHWVEVLRETFDDESDLVVCVGSVLCSAWNLEHMILHLLIYTFILHFPKQSCMVVESSSLGEESVVIVGQIRDSPLLFEVDAHDGV